MEFVDAFDALARDDKKRRLHAQALSTLPPSTALASDVEASFAPLPPAPFQPDDGEQRRLADDVGVVIGYTEIVADVIPRTTQTIVGVAILCTGDVNGIVAFGPIGYDVTVDFRHQSLQLRIAVLAQTSNVGL